MESKYLFPLKKRTTQIAAYPEVTFIQNLIHIQATTVCILRPLLSVYDSAGIVQKREANVERNVTRFGQECDDQGESIDQDARGTKLASKLATKRTFWYTNNVRISS